MFVSAEGGWLSVSLCEDQVRSKICEAVSEMILRFQQYRPVSRENVERRRLVAHVVHLFDGIGHAALGHHLLVLSGGALEGFPHVDVLQGN